MGTEKGFEPEPVNAEVETGGGERVIPEKENDGEKIPNQISPEKTEQIKNAAQTYLEDQEKQVSERRVNIEKKGSSIEQIFMASMAAVAAGAVAAEATMAILLAKAGASLNAIGSMLNGMKPEFMSPEAFSNIDSVLSTPMLEAGIVVALGVFAISMTPRIKLWFAERKLEAQKEEFNSSAEKSKIF